MLIVKPWKSYKLLERSSDWMLYDLSSLLVHKEQKERKEGKLSPKVEDLTSRKSSLFEDLQQKLIITRELDGLMKKI